MFGTSTPTSSVVRHELACLFASVIVGWTGLVVISGASLDVQVQELCFVTSRVGTLVTKYTVLNNEKNSENMVTEPKVRDRHKMNVPENAKGSTRS